MNSPLMTFRLLLLVLTLSFSATFSLAHSGGTDSRGGHHDRKNGGYHYHHGMGPHDHPGGVCPYQQSSLNAPTRKTATEKNVFQRHPILTAIGALVLLGFGREKYNSWKSSKR